MNKQYRYQFFFKHLLQLHFRRIHL